MSFNFNLKCFPYWASQEISFKSQQQWFYKLKSTTILFHSCDVSSSQLTLENLIKVVKLLQVISPTLSYFQKSLKIQSRCVLRTAAASEMEIVDPFHPQLWWMQLRFVELWFVSMFNNIAASVSFPPQSNIPFPHPFPGFTLWHGYYLRIKICL